MRLRPHALIVALLAAPTLAATGCNNGWNSKDQGPDAADDGDGDDSQDIDQDDTGGGDGGDDGGDDTGGDTGDPAGDLDQDGDGYTPNEGDCDDADPEIHPGAEEVCDGVDNDCDGSSDADQDADGDSIRDCADFCPIQVHVSAAAGGDGSHAHPFQAIQEGIDATVLTGCYEVEVRYGTYYENIDFKGYPADVRAVSGPAATTIDGGAAGSVVTFATGETEDARLYGFTVTNGAADRGAGVHVDGASPTIEGNVITGNAAAGSTKLGGGVYLYESDATVIDNTISDNDAGYGGADNGNDGGGIAILFGEPLVQGNTVQGNTAGDGGGIWMAHTDALVVNNIFDGNAAHDTGRTDDSGYTLYGQGGGVDFQANTAGVLFAANIVTNNVASSHGGGVAVISFYETSTVAAPQIENNVIAYNAVSSGSYGGGLSVWGVGGPTVTNNIVYANDGVGVYTQYGNLSFRYNDVYGNDTDASGALGDPNGSDGNVSSDPGFTSVSDDGDVSNDDFALRSSSGLVDAGDPAETDPDGSRSDIGAYGGSYGAW